MAEPWSTFHFPGLGFSTAPQLHCCSCLERSRAAQKRGSLGKACSPFELLTTCASKGSVPHPCCSHWSVPTPRSHTSFLKVCSYIIFFRVVSTLFFILVSIHKPVLAKFMVSQVRLFNSLMCSISCMLTCYILSELQYPGEIPVMNLHS